ncbi:MAG TPA: GNAT family N-acetyltransferase [Gemmatimonadales bacterium]|nr:GNAT family N-acetyltransferase [Gemmatimonadales bacterium]
MTVLETGRLRLRRLEDADAPFILNLLNQPSFLRYIGDKGVRNLDQARDYIRTGPAASYEKHGFGLYLVMLADGTPIGMCGLVRRDALEHADIGYSFLPEHWSKGYALEAARGLLHYARNTLGLGKLLAIVSPENASSIRLLEKLGFRFEREQFMKGDNEDLVRVYGLPDGNGSEQ